VPYKNLITVKTNMDNIFMGL